MSAPVLLIVEDERIAAEDLKETLIRLGYGVKDIVRTGELAVEKAGLDYPDLILMDIHLAGKMDGITAAWKIKSQYDIPIIFLTAFTDTNTLDRAKITEPYAYLVKPFEDRELKSAIEISLYKHAADRQLQQYQASIIALLNATRHGLFLVGTEGMLLAINATMAERAGTTESELVNKPIMTLLINKAVSSKMMEEIDKSISGTSRHFDEEFKGKWFENHIFPITDKYGSVIQIAVYSVDITDIKGATQEIKKLNDQVKKEEEFLLIIRSTLDEVGDWVIITSILGDITYVNNAFERKTGYSRDDLIGKHITTLQDPKDVFPLQKFRFLQEPRSVWTGDALWESKSGVRIPASVKSIPIMKDHQPLSRVFIMHEKI